MYLKEINQNKVLTIEFNRPEVHNAFDDKMISELTNEFEQIDPKQVAMVLIKGAGASFSAGADLNWMKKMAQYSFEENVADSLKLEGLFAAINTCPIPVIAYAHGAVLGGGMGILACCDYVLCEQQTKLGFTEVRLGLAPAVISPYVIAKIGESHARAHFLSGEKFDAQSALLMGLVHKIVSSNEAVTNIENVLLAFSRAAPLACMQTKQLISKVCHQGRDSLVVKKYTSETIAKLRASAEGQEGMGAMLEKRRAKF